MLRTSYQEALKLIHRYLCDRSQKVKVGFPFSNELDILCSVPQGSIFSQLLFTIDICDLFVIDMSSDTANYAVDITPNACAPYYDKLKENLELITCKIFNWFNITISKLMLLIAIFSYRSISLLPQTAVVLLLKIIIR